MTVKAILTKKGTDVLTIEPTKKLADATRLLAEHAIGALVVTGADRRIVGIVSERDIVQELAAHGPASLDLPLTDVMTRRVTTCSMNDTVISVMERMTEGRFRHMPVVNGDIVVGIVTIGDVVNYRLQELEYESLQLKQLIVG